MRSPYTGKQPSELIGLLSSGRATVSEAAERQGVALSTAYYWMKRQRRMVGVDARRVLQSKTHAHLHAYVDGRVSAGTVEIMLDGRRIASPARSLQRGHHTTRPEHMPSAHRAHQGVERVAHHQLGRNDRPQTRALAEAIIVDGPTRSRGTARASASCCGWASDTATCGWRRRARRLWRRELARTVTSTRF